VCACVLVYLCVLYLYACVCEGYALVASVAKEHFLRELDIFFVNNKLRAKSLHA